MPKIIEIPAPFFDVAYVLGLAGPSPQGGTSRTDNVANVTLKNSSCDAIAEATNIRVSATELTYPTGKRYLVALDMDVKPLGKCYGVSWIAGNIGQGPIITVEFKNVNYGLVYQVGWPFPLGCGDPPYHFSQSREIPDGGWLQDWAATTLRVDGGFSPC